MSGALEWVDPAFIRQCHEAVAELERGAQGCLHWTSGEWLSDCRWCVASDILKRRQGAGGG